MAEWVKLHAKIAESEDFAALQAADPNAALLFLMSLPIAAPWGILPRSAAVFRGRVAPMFDLSLSQVETCLRLVLDQGMYREYTDRDGKAHLYVTTWTQNQTRQWGRVGPPPCDLPPAWEPPADIARAIAVSSKAKRWLTVETLEAHLQDAESKTRLRLVLDQSETSLPKRGRGRGESPETPYVNDSTLPAADVVPDDPFEDARPQPVEQEQPTAQAATAEKPEQSATPGRAETPEQAAIHRLWDAFELPGKPSPEKGEKPGYSSVLLLVQTHGIPLLDQLSAHVQADPTARLPDGAKPWPWFCKTARAYLGAPWKWDGTGNGNGDARKAKPREEFILTRWGKRYPASEWSPGEANHVAWMKAEDNWDPETGRTLRPVPTFCCVDGYFYPGDGSERFEVAPV